MSGKLSQRYVLTSPITNAPLTAVVERITELARNHQNSYVWVSAVHQLTEVYLNKELREYAKNAEIITPDGMPIKYALKILYGVEQERITGADLLAALLTAAEEKELSVFFYGCTNRVLETTEAFLKIRAPKLRIAGYYSPPFRPLTEAEINGVTQMITQSGAHIVFVALGCPKQERWVAENSARLPAVLIGIGAALPFLSGSEKRAPKWIQNLCLEWTYRLILDPRRLFIRYLSSNTLFLLLLPIQFLKTKLGRSL
jgi:N-acetylglucosaminyldiphosphoundecaprenol N-acetyl-beta-D-mannosaminyltransferase